MKLLLLFITSVLSATGFSAGPPVGPVASAVKEAERFVARHGYTPGGHPEGQPVERASLYDILHSQEELILRRRGILEQRASCVRTRPDGSYSVLFQSTKDSDEFWFVAITGERPYLGHQTVRRSADCVSVPEAAP